MLSDYERRMLQETHDSTLKQELRIEQIHGRLDKGEERFAAQDQRIETHHERIEAVEAVTRGYMNERKSRVWWKRLAIGALAVPAADWLWNLITSLRKGP